MQCGLKYTGLYIKSFQDKELFLLLENIFLTGTSSVTGDRHLKSDKNKKILYLDANNLYGWAMSQFLLSDEIEFDKDVKLEDKLITPDDSDIGFIVECDLKNPDNIKEKTKISLFVLKIKLFLKINLVII